MCWISCFLDFVDGKSLEASRLQVECHESCFSSLPYEISCGSKSDIIILDRTLERVLLSRGVSLDFGAGAGCSPSAARISHEYPPMEFRWPVLLCPVRRARPTLVTIEPLQPSPRFYARWNQLASSGVFCSASPERHCRQLAEGHLAGPPNFGGLCEYCAHATRGVLAATRP